MKKLILLVVTLVSSLMPTAAQTLEQQFDAEVDRAFELQNQREIMVEAMQNSLQTLKQTAGLDDETIFAISTEITDAMIPQIIVESRKLYKEYLTLDEMRELNNFYASPVGQKMIRLTPTASAMGMRVAQSPEMTKKVQEIVAKYL